MEDDRGIQHWQEWQAHAVATAERDCLMEELEFVEWQLMCLLDQQAALKKRIEELNGGC